MKANKLRTIAHAGGITGWLGVCAVCLTVQSFPVRAIEADLLDRIVDIHIPKNTPLEDALIDWATRAGVTIMINSPDVANHLTQHVEGKMKARESLSKLLLDTGLTYTQTDDRIRVFPSGAFVMSSGRRDDVDPGHSSDEVEGAAPGSPPPDSGTSFVPKRERLRSDGNIEEVLVTAEKRSERLQDVPIPVTSLNVDSLSETNQTHLEDYFAEVPGLTYINGGGNTSLVTIRGIGTGGGVNPTVSVLIDDVPFGSSTSLGGSGAVPEFDPSDLSHVEVLRGPQGTLYGASSLGGLIKYVTRDPSTDHASARLQLGTNSVQNGAEWGYSFHGSLNVPMSSTLALLLIGYSTKDPGYIDNPTLGARGVNEGHTTGARLSALWTPSNAFSLKLSGWYQDQNTEGAGYTEIQPGLSNLQQLSDLQQFDTRGTGAIHRVDQVYMANAKANFGKAELTSISAYSIDRYHDSLDYDALLGFLDTLTEPFFGIPNNTTSAGLPFGTNESKFTQEIRLSTPIGSRLEWLIGAFYEHEYSQDFDVIDSQIHDTGDVVATWATLLWHTTYTEYAAFTDFTIHLTDAFDVQLGGRESHIQQSYSENDSGPFVPIFEGFPSPVLWPEVATRENSFTYLVTPRFTLSPHLMAYARLASGYRPGGPNPTASLLNLPTSFRPDRSSNYEVGLKGDLLDKSLAFDASLYYIDWKDIQLAFVDPNIGFGFNANGSHARSRGAELSLQYRPVSGLRLSTWVSFNEAVLTKDFPPGSAVYGPTGSPLPFSTRFSGGASVDYDFRMGRKLTGVLGATTSYVGERFGGFSGASANPAPRQPLGAYDKTDLHLGVEDKDWRATLYVNNLTDRRGLLSGGAGSATPMAFTFIRPRTVGVSLSVTF